MEKFSATTSLDQTELELPPGFRFHPTDEELITHYLYPKVMDNNFSTLVIGEVDLNKVEPWELPWRAKMGEKEWYFYSKRDRKYPTGSRTNRASKAGYWKTTGERYRHFQEKNSFWNEKNTGFFTKGGHLMEKKTNWVMHEYRLVGNLFESIESCYAEKNEYVLCRIFKKSSGGKKVDISSMKNNQKDDSVASNLPTLIDLSSDEENPKRIMAVDSPNVSCFSSFLMDKNPLLDNNLIIPDFPSSSSMSASVFSQNLMVSSQSGPSYIDNLQYTDLSFMQEQPVLGVLLDEQGNGQNANVGFWWENDMCNYYPPLHNNANVDFNCLWN